MSCGRRVLESLRSQGVEVEVFEGTVPELPMDIVLTAIREAVACAPQCVVGLGGGSSIDLAKLVALGVAHGDDLRSFYGEEQIPGPIAPLIAIPTTAGTGSEVTPVAVLTDPAAVLKVGISSRHLIPTYALVDPTLTHGCPPSVTASVIGIPSSLAELQVAEEELPELARQALRVSRLIVNNPRELGEQDLLEILRAAWRGELARGAAAVS